MAGAAFSSTLQQAPGTAATGIVVPSDLQAAFAANPAAGSFFESLSNSLRRYHVDNINAAKGVETRQRRIDKAIGLFLAQKQR